MTTETRAPSEFKLAYYGQPKGEVDPQGWPHIAYDVGLTYQDREVWRGLYRLGVGHVKPYNIHLTGGVPGDRDRKQKGQWLSEDWERKPASQFIDKQLWADVAAVLARVQKVAPSLDDVLNSLLFNGSAFFDAQSFPDWCSDLGYDSDSIKAKAIYDACVETGRQLVAALGVGKIQELRELYQDY